MMFSTVFMIVALVLFALAAFGPPNTNPPASFRVVLVPAGLFFWCLAQVVVRLVGP